MILLATVAANGITFHVKTFLNTSNIKLQRFQIVSLSSRLSTSVAIERWRSDMPSHVLEKASRRLGKKAHNVTNTDVSFITIKPSAMCAW